MRSARAGIALAIAAALAACGGTSQTRGPDAGIGPVLPEEETRPARRPDPNALEIRFEEGGGATAFTRALSVNPAMGTIDLRSGNFPPQRLRVQRSELAHAVELVGGPGFGALKSRYGATLPEPGAPLPGTYRIVVTRGTEERSVLTEENAETQPAVLQQAIAELLRLRRLVEQLGS